MKKKKRIIRDVEEYTMPNNRKNAMGMKIDKLTSEQKKYLASWEMGT